MIRRSALVAVGGFRDVAWAEDYDLWLRMSRRTRLASLEEPLVLRRLAPGQLSSARDTTRIRVGLRDEDVWLDDDVGVVEEVVELGLDVAVVDVDRDRANLEAPEQTLDELDAVAHVQSNVIAGPDTDTRQVAGDAIRALVQLDVCATTTIAHERRAVRNQIRDALVQICQIQ